MILLNRFRVKALLDELNKKYVDCVLLPNEVEE